MPDIGALWLIRTSLFVAPERAALCVQLQAIVQALGHQHLVPLRAVLMMNMG